MKRYLLATSALLLALPDIALSQDAKQAPVPGARPVPPVARPASGGIVRPSRPGRPQIQPPRPVKPAPPPRPGRPEIQPPRSVPPRPPRPLPPHRPGAGRPPHFRPVHGPIFRYPRGYRYRRWVVGLLLPHVFLSSSYYYGDWTTLGIGPPPPGYRWVRYGPDLLLVRTGTGRIADVIYGAFY